MESSRFCSITEQMAGGVRRGRHGRAGAEAVGTRDRTPQSQRCQDPHPRSKGGSSSNHYGGNPETYMNIGEAMVELLKN
jgi:hypothetical protein